MSFHADDKTLLPFCCPHNQSGFAILACDRGAVRAGSATPSREQGKELKCHRTALDDAHNARWHWEAGKGRRPPESGKRSQRSLEDRWQWPLSWCKNRGINKTVDAGRIIHSGQINASVEGVTRRNYGGSRWVRYVTNWLHLVCITINFHTILVLKDLTTTLLWSNKHKSL